MNQINSIIYLLRLKLKIYIILKGSLFCFNLSINYALSL
jgi:hypothetical protein